MKTQDQEKIDLITKNMHGYQLAKILSVITYLQANFPKAFLKQRLLPLKVGIGQDLVDFGVKNNIPELSHRRIKKVLRFYTRCPDYIKSCSEGAIRVDLDGNPAGTITAEDAQFIQEHQSKKSPIIIGPKKIHKAFLALTKDPEKEAMEKARQEKIKQEIERKKQEQKKALIKDKKKKKQLRQKQIAANQKLGKLAQLVMPKKND